MSTCNECNETTDNIILSEDTNRINQYDEFDNKVKSNIQNYTSKAKQLNDEVNEFEKSHYFVRAQRRFSTLQMQLNAQELQVKTVKEKFPELSWVRHELGVYFELVNQLVAFGDEYYNWLMSYVTDDEINEILQEENINTLKYKMVKLYEIIKKYIAEKKQSENETENNETENEEIEDETP